HFHPPVLLVQNNKTLYKNPSLSICRTPYEDSTGNFNAHIKVCDPEKKGTIVTFAAGCTYNAAKFRWGMVKWVISCHRPFAAIANEPLRDNF
ncbi:hypothetical protein MPER_00287, partial [Moniliophthora perniciosa FA553]